jgi:hypothetical protein
MLTLKKLVVAFFIVSHYAHACECPLSSLSLGETNKYEIIFKGRIHSVRACAENYGEAIFDVEELYKGNATKQFKVLFECGVPCEQQLMAGDEWIIYSRYKQIDNALLDWCSRSRKHFSNEKEDYYTFTFGNDYYDEVKFLREKLGLHRLLGNEQNQESNRNIIPDKRQTIIVILISLLCIILFYWLFNRFFR